MKYIISEKGEAIFLNQYFLGFFVEDWSRNGVDCFIVVAKFFRPSGEVVRSFFYGESISDVFDTKEEAQKKLRDLVQNNIREV